MGVKILLLLAGRSSSEMYVTSTACERGDFHRLLCNHLFFFGRVTVGLFVYV